MQKSKILFQVFVFGWIAIFNGGLCLFLIAVYSRWHYTPIVSRFCNEPTLKQDTVFDCVAKWSGSSNARFTLDGERLIQVHENYPFSGISLLPYQDLLGIPQKQRIDFEEEHPLQIHTPAITEHWIAIESYDHESMNLRIWDYEQQQLIKLLPNVAPFLDIKSLEFSGDGAYLAMGIQRDEAQTKVWDTQTWELKVLPGNGLMNFFPNTHQMVILSSSSEVILWDVDANLELQKINLGVVFEKPNQFLISPNGEVLAISDYNQSIYLFEIKTWKLMAEIPVTNGVLGVPMAFSPDSQFLATLEDKAFPVSPGEELPKGIRHFLRDPNCPDTDICVGALVYFGYLKLWDVQTGSLFHTVDFGEQNTWVQGLAFSPDGTRIVLSGETNYLLEKKP
ncbi:MAG TPA: hypothetical protein PK530_06100 [Anaerolineales bacterium]|nr:hypothetical protein [Anaerolineales bacterium]